MLEENRRIGLNDPRNFIDTAGKLKPVSKWTAEMAADVSKIEVVKKNAAAGDAHTDTVVKLWPWNKNSALELLAKHLGLLQPSAVETRFANFPDHLFAVVVALSIPSPSAP